jgi:hypothetical protein
MKLSLTRRRVEPPIARAGDKITGMRLWIVAISSFGGQVTIAQVAERLPTSLRLNDQIPAKPKGRSDRRRTKNGVFVRPSFRHS